MPALPNPKLSRAVLIGTSQFDHLPNLPAVRNNLEDLRTALTDPEHGIIGADKCHIVADPETPRDLMQGLRRVLRTTDDLLLVYYAGHGLRNDAGDKLYLTVRESDSEELDGSAVEFDWVKRALEVDSHARTNLLVLDCCYSGMAAGLMSGEGISRWEIAVRGSAVLTSSPKNKKSHSPEGHRHTAFTGKMIQLLEHGSPLGDEPLTVNTLYQRVAVSLTKENFPEPKIALTETSGELLVRRFTAPPKAPAPTTGPFAAPPPAVGPTPGTGPTAIQSPPSVASVQLGPITGPPPVAPTTGPFVAQAPPRGFTTAPVPPPPFAAPLPAPSQPSPATPSQSNKWLRLTGLRALWVLAGLFAPMALGGFVGVVTGGTASGDATLLGVGLGATVILGVPLWLRRKSWLSLRRELGPPLITRSVPGLIVVFVGLALSLMTLIGGLTSNSPSEHSIGSDITYQVAGLLYGVEVFALCAYLLITWVRARRAETERQVAAGSRP